MIHMVLQTCNAIMMLSLEGQCTWAQQWWIAQLAPDPRAQVTTMNCIVDLTASF